MRGKAVLLRRPAIAGIRDLRIPRVQIWSLPLGKGIIASVHDKSLTLDPRDVQFIDMPVGKMHGSAQHSLLKPLLVAGETPHAIPLVPQVDSKAGPIGDVPAAGAVYASLVARLKPPVVLAKITPFVGEWKLRPYQLEALNALIETHCLLLADDPGTGKSVTAASALSLLVHQGRARRALIICSKDRRRHWEVLLATWAPGLAVNSVRIFEGHPSNAWSDPGEGILVDYEQLADDFEQGSLYGSKLEFDVLILADATTILRQADKRMAALRKIRASWRWGLSGGMPQSPREWVKLFECVIPETEHAELKRNLADPCERYLPFVVRRTKADIAQEMPAWNRQELWLDLDKAEQEAYGAALAEERDRLTWKGSSASCKDISDAMQRLCRITNHHEGDFKGPKVRMLLELVGEITAAHGKVVVFCQGQLDEMDRLQKALEAFGTVRLDARTNAEERSKLADTMGHDTSARVLMAHVEAMTEPLPIPGITYVIHFNCGLDAEGSRQAEWNLFPSAPLSLPVNVFELWIAHTHEEQLHTLLTSRLPPEARDPHTRPRAEWHRPLTIDDWLTAVLQVGSHRERALASE